MKESDLMEKVDAKATESAQKSAEAVVNQIIETIDKKFEEIRKEKKEQAKDEVKNIVVGEDRESQDPKGGFKCFSEFAQDVAKMDKSHGQNISDRLKKYFSNAKAAGDGLNIASDEYGGALIPVEFRANLYNEALEQANFIQRCTQIPMATNAVDIPVLEKFDRSSGYISGTSKFYWVGEEEALTSGKPKFSQIRLTLSDMTGLVYTTNNMLEDSPISLEPLLNQHFREGIAWTLDNVILNGTGANQPLGVVNAPATVSVSKETGQTADTIEYDNIAKMYQRQMRKGSCIWVANHDTFTQLTKLNIPVGTGGQLARVFDVSAGTLMGRPIVFTEHAQSLGDAGDIMCISLQDYLVGQKVGQGMRVESSMHLKFDYNQMAFKVVMRVDGQPWMRSAVTPRYSSETLSPFVSLAARA